MAARFSLLTEKNLPKWVKEIKFMALAKVRRYSGSDYQPEMVGPQTKLRFRGHHSFAWSFDVDDMINEGCLAYLKAIDPPKIPYAEAYAKKAASNAMSNLVIKEGRSHGLVYKPGGGMTLASGISMLSRLGNKRRPGFSKGTAVGNSAINAAKTHCKRGHEFTPENTYLAKRNDGGTNLSRLCKICRKDYSSSQYKRNRELNVEQVRKQAAIRQQRRRAKIKAMKGDTIPRTHCKLGHELSGDNVATVQRSNRSGVWRRCKECRRKSSDGMRPKVPQLTSPEQEKGIQAALPEQRLQ